MRRFVRRLPALAVLLAVAPAVAHGPVEKQYKKELPPGMVMPPAVPAQPDATRAGVEFRATVRPLRQLGAEATLVVVADVVRTESFDDGRLQVYRLRVGWTLGGTAPGPDVGVVDIRGDSKRPPVLVDGEHVVAFLHAAAKLSYLSAQLGDQSVYELAARREAVVPVTVERDADVVAAILDARAVTAVDDDAGRAKRRELAGQALASRSPRLLLDALVEFDALPGWPPLTDVEVAAFGAILRDRTVPAPLRVQLLGLIGEHKATQALSAVLAAETDSNDVLDAVLGARVALGSPASREEMAGYLKSADPGVRSAAARALAALKDPAMLPEVGRLATADADPGVRLAAVDALGTTGLPAAVPIVAQTFDGDDRELRQHAGRALIALGGPAMEHSLVDLALKGKSTDTQRYAALLLVVLRGRDSAAVRDLLAGSPSADVRAVIEQPLEFQHMHKHDGP